jgi:hypothetical protein
MNPGGPGGSALRIIAQIVTLEGLIEVKGGSSSEGAGSGI